MKYLPEQVNQFRLSFVPLLVFFFFFFFFLKKKGYLPNKGGFPAAFFIGIVAQIIQLFQGLFLVICNGCRINKAALSAENWGLLLSEHAFTATCRGGSIVSSSLALHLCTFTELGRNNAAISVGEQGVLIYLCMFLGVEA